jgi:hypothetical protein
VGGVSGRLEEDPLPISEACLKVGSASDDTADFIYDAQDRDGQKIIVLHRALPLAFRLLMSFLGIFEIFTLAFGTYRIALTGQPPSADDRGVKLGDYVDASLNSLLGSVLSWLDVLYGRPWVVPFVLFPAMLVVAGFFHWQAARRFQPYLKAAKKRIAALQSALGTDKDPSAERDSFASNYVSVAETMIAPGAGAATIIQAWREFEETIIDSSLTPIRNTARPSAFFSRSTPRFSDLTFASNVFVGVGLILTFLGLVVALNKAAAGMTGGDVNAAKGALAGLLTVAGAKFFTSIGGLIASIWLRFVEHGLTKRVRAMTDQMCELLERGLLYVSAQRLAVEQLDVLREQRDQLKTFNTDFAMQLGDRIGAQFQLAVAPMNASMDRLAQNLGEMTSGIGDSAKRAIEEISGDQLRGLSDVLAALSLKIEGISSAVAQSGGEAAQQIRGAGADFAQAATEIRSAFERLTGQVEAIGGVLQASSQAAAKAQEDMIQTALRDLADAQAKNGAVIAQVIEDLRNAGKTAAGIVQSSIQGALSDSLADGQRLIAGALQESGEVLRANATELARAVGEAATTVSRASDGFARSGQEAIRSADAFGEIATRANVTAENVDRIGKGLQEITTPLARAVQAIDASVAKMQTSLQSNLEADAAALQQMRDLAEGMRQTHSAAEKAWLEYRARFEGVDRAFASSADQMAETLRSTLNELIAFAGKIDRELGAAVGKLSSSLSVIEDYASALDDYIKSERRA